MADAGAYYGQQRSEMLRFLPEGTKRLIDIGCGEGRFSLAVRARFPGCEVWGVEPNTQAAALAAKNCDKIINSPIETLEELPSLYFDVVTMNDVLEHLQDPDRALRTARRILRPGGHLILSLPNVAYYVNIKDLVFKNEWEYKDFGILDRTHLRFFTAKSARKTIAEAGFEVVQVVGINPPRLAPHYALTFAMFRGITRPMRYPQFAIVARIRQE